MCIGLGFLQLPVSWLFFFHLEFSASTFALVICRGRVWGDNPLQRCSCRGWQSPARGDNLDRMGAQTVPVLSGPGRLFVKWECISRPWHSSNAVCCCTHAGHSLRELRADGKGEENIAGALSPFYQQRDLRAFLHLRALAMMQPKETKDVCVCRKNGPVDAVSCPANGFTQQHIFQDRLTETQAKKSLPRHQRDGSTVGLEQSCA